MDCEDAVGQLKPDVAWQGVRLEGDRVNVEDGGPFCGDSGVLPSAASFANDLGCTRGPLVWEGCGHTRTYPEDQSPLRELVSA